VAKTKRKKNGKGSRPTTVKVSAVTEWTDFHGILLLFGIRRSLAYHLVKSEPALRGASVNIKGKDEMRGKRLFNVPKFRQFLESKIVTP
jgi:hypothetical protein